VNQINHENYLMVVDLTNGASLKNELSTFKAYVRSFLRKLPYTNRLPLLMQAILISFWL